jgi:hypothetical protein
MKMDGEITAGGYIVCHRNVGIMVPGDLAAITIYILLRVLFKGFSFPPSEEIINFFRILGDGAIAGPLAGRLQAVMLIFQRPSLESS